MITKRIGLEDARVNLAEILQRARYKNERFLIAKHGEPLALIIPINCIPTLDEHPVLVSKKLVDIPTLVKLPAA